MKLTTIFMLVIFLSASAEVQSQVISISAKKLSLEKVLDEIQKQSGYEFLYSSEMIKNARPVDMDVKNVGIDEVLSLCFKNQPFQYTVIGKTVVLKLNTDPSNGNKLKASPIVITGKVWDDEGPLPGATIIIKGSSLGTTTDQLGNFSLSVPDTSSRVLVFTFLGYETKELTVTKSIAVTIKMVKKIVVGNEVVVVGYKTEKKKNLTSAVGTISAKDMENQPYTNIYEALNGRIPGFDITQDYTPGGGGNRMLIRGKNTGLDYLRAAGDAATAITPSTNNFGFGNDQPLVLIDGFEGDINLVNPQDIESVTVLKDASAAIYGIRAANGVVLVTTKKGELNSLKVNYDYYAGLTNFTRRPTYLSSWQQATLVNETIANESAPGGGGGVIIGGGGGRLTPYTPEEIQKFKDGSDLVNYPNTNWEDQYLRTGSMQQRHNLSINGGDKRSKYALSLEYMQQDGNIPNLKNQRYSSRFNMVSKLGEKFAFNGGVNFAYSPATGPITGAGAANGTADPNILLLLTQFSPMLPQKWANGAYSNNKRSVNPEAWLETPSSYKNTNSAVNGNLGVNWTPLKGLSVKPSLGYNYSTTSSKYFLSELVSYANGAEGSPLVENPFTSNYLSKLDETIGKSYNLTSQVVVDYTKLFGNHEIGVMVGGMRSYAYANFLNVYKENFLNTAIQTPSIAAGQGNKAPGGSELEAVQQAFFGRLQYNYNDLFILESTLRADGTTAFAPDNRYKIFPAFSGAWIISGHDFYKDAERLNKTLSFLKLRASWGILGNSSVGYYTYLQQLGVGSYSFNNQLQTSVYPNGGYNPDVRWEETRTINFGLDARMFRDKLSLAFDAYHKQTNGLMQQVGVPANYGLSAPFENSGSMYNKGLEMDLRYSDKIKAFIWSVSANAAYNINKITSYRVKERSTDLSTAYDRVEGESLYTIWGLVSDGIYQNQQEVTGSPVLNSTVGPGDIRYVDINKDGKIDGNDRVNLGQATAPVKYGLALEGGWKNFGLRLLFRGDIGRKVLMGQSLGQVSNADNKVVTDYWDRWTTDNPSSKFPRSWNNYTQNNPTATVSDFWMRKANYIKLANLTFSYNLPAAACKRVGLGNVRMYYTGSNLFVIAPGFWNWLDPETTMLQASSNGYPATSLHSFGISVGF
ncbi:TonB-dependent receptor [Solitalea lacus]|uniref:TonB-dependent receptor n=1 Tax=Solitalea lacus TaxID=2911172 RepID=UPI001EDB7C9C|nr:TonB-dependent receptor [Solitalea lacus]UKJ06569.1 TonB-dependent receptor [Solitalea lacus]